jgi:hypothetical protein
MHHRVLGNLRCRNHSAISRSTGSNIAPTVHASLQHHLPYPRVIRAAFVTQMTFPANGSLFNSLSQTLNPLCMAIGCVPLHSIAQSFETDAGSVQTLVRDEKTLVWKFEFKPF